MRRAEVPEAGISTRQRLFIFHETGISAEEALALEDEQLTAALLIEKKVKASNIAAAGVGPRLLKSIGVEDPKDLRIMGFDSLYLADGKFASEANAAYGADAVREAFLISASDAVSIAGTDAVGMLGITANDLLAVCAGAPTEAHSVLQQLPKGVSLTGVSPSTLLDTGLRKAKLAELGYSLTSVATQTGARAEHLAKLGYTL